MTQEIVRIEFRYTEIVDGESKYRNDTITIGVYDTLEEAIIEGNKALDVISTKFKVDEKFEYHTIFGRRTLRRLVSNTCIRPRNPIYFASIRTLHIEDLSETIDNILSKKFT